MRAHGAGPIERAHAVLVERRRVRAHLREVIDLVLVGARARASSRKGTSSSSTVVVARDAHVLIDDVGEPDEVVREARAHAAPGVRVPPVLHVALDELPRAPRSRRCARATAGSAYTNAITSCSWSRNPNAPLLW